MSGYIEHFIKKTIHLTDQDLKFIEWLQQVETIVKEEIGFSLIDINDMPYYISFEDGILPEEMAEQTIKNFDTSM